MDGIKWNFSKTLTSRYQFQSTPRNVINQIKMADRCFTLLSLIVRLISNLTPCFQRPSAQYKPTPKKMKDGANLLFRGVIIDLAQQRTSVWCRAILFIPDLAFCRPESFSLLLRKVSKTHASMQARAVGLSFKSYVFKSIHRIGVNGWKRCENVTWVRVVENFLENGEKKLRFQTNNATCGRGLRV